jgi:Fic family protein
MFHEVDFEWRGRPAKASVPPMLADVVIDLPESVVRSTERAAAAIERSSDHLPPSWEPLARLLLRFEGVASSSFEKIRAPLEEIAVAEITASMKGPSAWVADNLAVVSEAVESARRTPLTVASLLQWHRRLMDHATNQLDPGLIGSFRDRPVWVGGSSPFDAAHVGPPPEFVEDLMEDLVNFANTDVLDVVTQASILHAQFESIHPFADGNGRLGRVLIGWLIVRRLGVSVPPPFSVFVVRDPGGYLSGLALYRLGEVTPWVRWFAHTLEKSASTATSLITDIGILTAEWQDRASVARTAGGRPVRIGATFWGVLAMLPEHPIISAALIQKRFGITNEAARQALRRLESLGIISPVELHSGAPGRPTRWWAAEELIDTVARAN